MKPFTDSSSTSEQTPPARVAQPEAAAPQMAKRVRAAKPGASAAVKPRLENLREDVNERADDFIKRFRENLLLQRAESIENYRQMLQRGVQ
ncbi:hypothetical protein HPP92_024272 [Vanilla planifolia]|uniref:Uncharacterized protein n=1 Tax=Vanilla planifolia TaxID=51239 RepID=A0A835PSE6_VANPL|nr:hypothetical protein HPP92_024599 [Vanilla planifolia]KAG0456484.1 hypothetical protein HPP92_024272 [Vanilla planifolia]